MFLGSSWWEDSCKFSSRYAESRVRSDVTLVQTPNGTTWSGQCRPVVTVNIQLLHCAKLSTSISHCVLLSQNNNNAPLQNIITVTALCLYTHTYLSPCSIVSPIRWSSLAPSLSVNFKHLALHSTVTGKRVMTAQWALQLLSAVERYFVSGDQIEVIVIPMLIEARIRNSKLRNSGYILMCIPLMQHNREVKLIQGFDRNNTLENEEKRPRRIWEEN